MVLSVGMQSKKKIEVGDWYLRVDGRNEAEEIKEEQWVAKEGASIQGMVE